MTYGGTYSSTLSNYLYDIYHIYDHIAARVLVIREISVPSATGLSATMFHFAGWFQAAEMC